MAIRFEKEETPVNRKQAQLQRAVLKKRKKKRAHLNPPPG